MSMPPSYRGSEGMFPPGNFCKIGTRILQFLAQILPWKNGGDNFKKRKKIIDTS